MGEPGYNVVDLFGNKDFVVANNYCPLRAYQQKAVDLLRANFAKGIRRQILCMPTGSGKTVVFSYIAKAHVAKGGRVLILTNREELCHQVLSALAIPSFL